LRYLDEITSLFEHLTHLTRIVDGMFGQLPQRGKMSLEFPTQALGVTWPTVASLVDYLRRSARPVEP
jgi:hypothetical protein